MKIVCISLVKNDTVEYWFFGGIFKLEQGYGLDCWSTWRLALDDVKQPQESCNIVASTGEWLVYISNGVLISKQWCFNFHYVYFCLHWYQSLFRLFSCVLCFLYTL